MSGMRIYYSRIFRQFMAKMILGYCRLIPLFVSAMILTYIRSFRLLDDRDDIKLKYRGGRADQLRENTQHAFIDRSPMRSLQ